MKKQKKSMAEKIREYYIKQKLLGLGLVALGVLSGIIFDGDITVALLIIPFGAYIMLTKEKVMTVSERFFDDLDDSEFDKEEKL